MKTPLLIDLDGVLRIGGKPANGLQEFFNYLKESERPAAIVSNTTLSTSQDIETFFRKNNIECPVRIITASDVTAEYVKNHYKSAKVFCSEKAKPLFDGIPESDTPEVVVMGDLFTDWNYESLNEIFRYVHNGADFVAMQKNKFWKTSEEGLLLDLGAFVSGIEYATGKKAKIVGKPSNYYFRMAVSLLGGDSFSSFYMVGDDLFTDIAGARGAGGKGILIYTGKTSKPFPIESEILPDHEVDDLLQLIKLVKKFG